MDLVPVLFANAGTPSILGQFVRTRHRKSTHRKPWVCPTTVPASFDRRRSRFDANIMLFSPNGMTTATIAAGALNLRLLIW